MLNLPWLSSLLVRLAQRHSIVWRLLRVVGSISGFVFVRDVYGTVVDNTASAFLRTDKAFLGNLELSLARLLQYLPPND